MLSAAIVQIGCNHTATFQGMVDVAKDKATGRTPQKQDKEEPLK